MTYAQVKETFVENMRNAVDKWNIRLVKLKQEAVNAKSDHREMLDALIKQIEDKTERIRTDLDDIYLIENGWLEIRKGIEGTVENLEESYKEALTYMM